MANINTKIKILLLDNLIWVLFLSFFFVDAVSIPYFFSFENIVNIFYHVSSLGLLVLAEGLILITGQLDLSVESTLVFAPGVALLICNAISPNTSPAIMILLSLAIGLGVGILNGTLITRLKMNSLLVTLATNIVLRGLVYFLLPLSIVNLAPGFAFAGSARVGTMPVAVLILVGIYIIFAIFMARSRFGRFLVATGGNPRASYIAGVKTDRVIVITFGIAGALAALAGIIAAGRQGSITNSMGIGQSIMAIAGPILGGISLSGGRGTVFGMLGGTLLLSLFDNSLTLMAVNVYLVNVVKGSLILLAIILDSVKSTLRTKILYRERVKFLKSKTQMQESSIH